MRKLDTELIHQSSSLIASSDMLQRAIEGSSKRAELIADGSSHSILLVKPAFKAYTDGSPVAVGDLVTFVTKKTIAGSSYCLHMSASEELYKERELVMRALKLDHDYILGGQELNFASAEHRPTMFRGIIFQSAAQQDNEGVLKGEDVITLYHKNFSSFLHFDPETHEKPVFYSSKRVNDKARKKCAWMWKVECVQVTAAAHPLKATEDSPIRLKHLITNMYLKQEGSALGLTKEYRDPATLFSMKQFNKYTDPEKILHKDMIFMRGPSGGWLGLAEEDDDDDIRTVPSLFKNVEIAPESDALIVLPVRPIALRNVVQLRRLCLTIIDYKKELEVLPDCQTTSTSDPNCSPHVFEVITECSGGLMNTLRKLIVNLTWGDDPDPMSRGTQ